MDAFALLGFSRRLDLDPAEVRSRFQEASLDHHPDRGGDADTYQKLVEAAGILESPARRWRHWAELEGWRAESRIMEMDQSMAAEFARVWDLLQRAQAATAAKRAAASALSKAMAERSAMVLPGEIADVIASLTEKEHEILRAGESPVSPEEAGRLSGHLACLARWRGELRAALASLA